MASIIDFAKSKMNQTVEHLKGELRALRTNRANPAMLDSVHVEIYGSQMPIKSVANVSAPEARQLLITPFDPQTAGAIAKAIERNPAITFVPVVDGHSVRINVPPMDEAMRKEIVKQARRKGEDAKVAVRDVRHKAKDQAKRAESDGELTQDDVRRIDKQIQEFTDKACQEIDAAVVQREAEIMTV